MTSKEIRQTFLDYFKNEQHEIVSSAPIVVKDDPTLMFTNAGMNQFKDYFLGHQEPKAPRISDTQKCLRVSGKHNDLEEVGRDSYHHTMFEMLGNWSFGDYFKEEAIFYAWDLLTRVYGIDMENIYITVFEGDRIDGTTADEEAATIWKKHIAEDRILYFDKKDNFWEMGDVGPCGPCSEIHVDLRSDEAKAKLSGHSLVNMDDPLVIEIWNLVFIQYQRTADGTLIDLPNKHIDTGMGFERLTMILQGKKSNYNTDIFSPFIEKLSADSGIPYTDDYTDVSKSDIAMRVIADHLRTVSFTIADGEMPSNTGAGYVIRRILRRAVRYNYSFLNNKKPYIYSLVPMLAQQFADVFPEVEAQKDFVSKVILEEEKSFLRTLEDGLKRLDALKMDDGTLSGEDAFILYDTYGFPFDLTSLVASEKGWKVDEKGFESALEKQKQRSRDDSEKSTGDWISISDSSTTEFIGYDHTEADSVNALRHRKVTEKGTDFNQLLLDKTPFYAEGGGQVGDIGTLDFGGEIIKVLDTKKENNLIIHYIDKIPNNINKPAVAKVDVHRRSLIESNHSATHLMHAALRQVLGEHVQQKGSLVREDLLRFDFSHFEKMTQEQIKEVESIVNSKIRSNIQLDERRSIPISEAQEAGAMMLFGEKYGDSVRMITFGSDYSVELCGGCHVDSTGQLGLFKIVQESGVAAGVRRITAISSEGAEKYLSEKLSELEHITGLFKNPKDLSKSIVALQDENKELQKKIDQLIADQAGDIKKILKDKISSDSGVNFLAEKVDISDSKAVKTLLFNLEKEVGNAAFLLGMESNGKAQLMIILSKNIVEEKGWHAGNLVKEVSKAINGGGGGQAFFASAGGTKPAGIDEALTAFKNIIIT